jgi:hypothetical protein
MRAAPGHDVCHSAGTRSEPLEHRAAVDAGVFDHQAAYVWRTLILGIAQSAFDQFFQHPRSALRLVTEDRQRIVDFLAANQVGQRAHLSGADAGMSMYRCVWHVVSLSAVGCGTIGLSFVTTESRQPVYLSLSGRT